MQFFLKDFGEDSVESCDVLSKIGIVLAKTGIHKQNIFREKKRALVSFFLPCPGVIEFYLQLKILRLI
jgi:hypothetical protein